MTLIERRLAQALFTISTVLYCITVNSAPLVTAITNAEFALIQGDSSQALNVIRSVKGINKSVLKLKVLYFLEIESTNEAAHHLKILEKSYSDDPDVFAFSSEVWRSIGHKVNIFSKNKYYKMAVGAKIKAGDIGSEHPTYLTIKASAMGQSTRYGGQRHLQKSLTEKIVQLDKKWGYIAQINLAQNQDKFGEAKSIAISASEDFSTDFFILNRVAKLYWTMRDYGMSQTYFSEACKNNPSGDWHTQIDWRNACIQSAIFSIEKDLNHEKGHLSLLTLLQEYQLPTEENFELVKLLASLEAPNTKVSVERIVKRFTENSKNNDLKRNADKLLKNKK